jgi:hypothetical protein
LKGCGSNKTRYKAWSIHAYKYYTPALILW